jgi:HSP20 family protein
LTLTGQRLEDKETKEENDHRRERSFGKFHRSFTLPAAVDSEKIVATYKAGVIEVKIPKPEQQKPKEIEIK